MRTARLKPEGHTFFHITSRVVDRRFIMADLVVLEFFVELMRRVEIFCGVRILAFAVLSNHFHILLEVPQRREISEEEVLERLAALDGPKKASARRRQWELWRQAGLEDRVQCDLARLRARMYDLSEYCKTLKQRFTQWYNRRTGRSGTLWEGRFQSVLIEGVGHALRTVAAYIDMNPVRAGLVADPKDYRWSGYGEATAGSKRAREGLCVVMQGHGAEEAWQEVARAYRLFLYQGNEERGLTPEGRPLRTGFSREEVARVLAEGGKLDRATLLRCRVRYFTDGVILGSKAFVEQVFQEQRAFFSPKRKTGARPMRLGDWGGLCVARDLRRAPVTVSPATG